MYIAVNFMCYLLFAVGDLKTLIDRALNKMSKLEMLYENGNPATKRTIIGSMSITYREWEGLKN